jgi:hypothetical protein
MNAMNLECEAIHRYRELEAWFTDRNLDELAGLCARLATCTARPTCRWRGRDSLMPVDALKAAAVPWVGIGDLGARSREFLWRLASPAELLELALQAEPSEECAAKLRAARGKLGPVDWEAGLESGTTPALAIGASGGNPDRGNPDRTAPRPSVMRGRARRGSSRTLPPARG